MKVSRTASGAALLRLGLLVCGACASAGPAGDPGIPAHELRRLHAEVAVGDGAAPALARLGRAVLRPGTAEPFASPLHVLSLPGTAAGPVAVYVFVTETRPAEGCPSVQYGDAPVVVIEDRIAATDWDFVERHWRGWGGSLAALRDAQARRRCEESPEPPASQPLT